MIAATNKTKRTLGQIASQKRATKLRTSNGNRRSSSAPGVIDATKSYSIPAFIKELGTTRSGLSTMRRRGLKVRMSSENRREILGSDFHDYLKSQPVAVLDE